MKYWQEIADMKKDWGDEEANKMLSEALKQSKPSARDIAIRLIFSEPKIRNMGKPSDVASRAAQGEPLTEDETEMVYGIERETGKLGYSEEDEQPDILKEELKDTEALKKLRMDLIKRRIKNARETTWQESHNDFMQRMDLEHIKEEEELGKKSMKRWRP